MLKTICVAVAIAALFLVSLTTIGRTHDQRAGVDPKVKSWIESLKDKNGVGCCSTADHEDVAWGIEGDRYWVVLDGEKRIVPPEAVLEGPNHLGHAQVWTYLTWEQGRPIARKVIRCFIPGSGS